MRLLVIGGSDAGIAAALRARELDPSVEVTVVVADAFPNFPRAALPCWVMCRTGGIWLTAPPATSARLRPPQRLPDRYR